MKQVLVTLMLSGLLLSACGRAPTPDLEAIVQAAVVATLTAQPSNTPAPTPTETPTSAPANTPPPTEAPKSTETPIPTDTPAPTATQTPGPTATPPPVVHVVQSGETLSGIAREYGVSLETLIAANNIADPSQVEVGQELAIPASEATVSQTEPTATSIPVPADTSVEELTDENKAMVIETALRLDESVVVRRVRIVREEDKETILVVIETQGGKGSIADEITLREAITSFIYAYQGDQRLGIEAKYVLVQAQNNSGSDSWYAVAAIGDVGRLAASELTVSEFLERIRVVTP